MSFPFYQQPDHMDCGPTCLRMVARYHGRSVALDELRRRSETTRTGSNLQSIADAAETLGFRTLGVKVSLEKVLAEEPFPCILHWNSSHFVVLNRKSKKAGKPLCKLPQDQVRGIVETHNTPELWDNEKEQMDGSADRSDAARA